MTVKLPARLSLLVGVLLIVMFIRRRSGPTQVTIVRAYGDVRVNSRLLRIELVVTVVPVGINLILLVSFFSLIFGLRVGQSPTVNTGRVISPVRLDDGVGTPSVSMKPRRCRLTRR